MTGDDRWRRVDELFHEALAQPPESRRAFIDAACKGDTALGRDVASLVDADARAGTASVESLAAAGAATWLADRRDTYTGTVLGRYRVVERIGSGGMGEVYRAEDTSLERPVAMKILRPEFLHDPERRRRFEDEARAVSTLNHPNIVVIHEVGRVADVHFIATELVEGETLRSRLMRGPLALRDTLDLGGQIAHALAAAHGAGIVHRDIKPDNVMIRPDGIAKVLDFGIAKLAQPNREAMTRTGLVMGTMCYMSPEQALGAAVDHRSDIFSLGVVLYAMSCGVMPFDGPSDAAISDALLHHDPDPPGRHRPDLPPEFDRIVLRALEKDGELRYQSAADLASELERLERSTGHPAGAIGTRRRPAPAHTPIRRWVPWAVAVAATAAALALALQRNAPPRLQDAPAPLRHFVIALPSIIEPDQTTGPPIAVSPDGKHLVFVRGPVATRRLYVRDMDRLDERPLPGTAFGQTPFFSPDSRRLGFVARGEVQTIALAGGPPATVGHVRGQRGLAWSADDTIVAATDEGLIRFAADHARSTLAQPRPELGETSYQWPEWLPDGRTLLYSVLSRDASGQYSVRVDALRPGTGERHTVVQNASFARYARSGHLVFYRDDALQAVSFDPVRVAVIGQPVAVLGHIAVTPSGVVPETSAGFSLSNDGTLVYIPSEDGGDAKTAFWVSRTGTPQPVVESVQGLVDPNLSPDGRMLAVIQHKELWLVDLERGARRKLRGEPDVTYMAPVWTPDGRRLVYTRQTTNGFGIYSLATADPALQTEIWRLDRDSAYPTSVSPDGRTLACMRSIAPGRYRVWVVGLGDGAAAPRPRAVTTANEQHPQFSPDGRWLAYSSDESGRFETYVESYPGRDEKWQVSTDGGVEPRWTSSGRQLSYRNDERMMSVRFDGGPSFAPGRPQQLFAGAYQDVGDVIDYAVAPADGRFLMIRRTDPNPAYTRVNVIVSWFTELARLLPRLPS